MPGDAEKVRRFDLSNLEVFGGVFESEQALQEYMGSDPEKPGRLMEDLYLWGDFIGHVEYRFLPKKTSSAEEALADFPYEEKIISVISVSYLLISTVSSASTMNRATSPATSSSNMRLRS